MCEGIDRSLLDLNKRYQTLYRSSEVQIAIKANMFCKLLFSTKFRTLFEKLRMRYIARNFSIQGNRIKNRENTRINDVSRRRICVYSCIAGKYDQILEPLVSEPNIDYLMFTDQQVSKKSVWKKIDISQWSEYGKLTATQMNRKIKMLPHRFLAEYDFSIYIDGSIEMVGLPSPMILAMGDAGLAVHYHAERDCIYDEAIVVRAGHKADERIVGNQMREYREAGFPRHYGLFECPVLVRNHRDEELCILMEQWWEEYEKYPTRDQLSLPYLVWRNHIDDASIYILGHDINRNPRFTKMKHL